MLNEFVGLRDILVAVSDNSAALACESILGLLDQEGCQDIEKLGAKEFKYPTYSDLKQNLADVQSAKKMFLRRFWKASGREAIRATAAARLAEIKKQETRAVGGSGDNGHDVVDPCRE